MSAAKKSKFSGLFGDPLPEESQVDQVVQVAEHDTQQRDNPTTQQVAPQPEPKKATTKAGKRNNPDYFQATSYIPRTLKDDVDMKLISERRRNPELDYSVLVENLLSRWVKGEI